MRWIEETIIKEGNRFTYSALLRKNAKNKIPCLSYLFNTSNELVVLAEEDKLSFEQARRHTHPARIVTVDTEYYDPGFKMHT